MMGMNSDFPDRPIVDIEDKDAIFHTVYDLDNRIQVPGAQYSTRVATISTMAKRPLARGIYDDKGRIMVAISYNSDNGDAWEWADRPEYREVFSTGIPDGCELRGLFDDALTATAQ